jgi:Ca-activated chloride channel family protein
MNTRPVRLTILMLLVLTLAGCGALGGAKQAEHAPQQSQGLSTGSSANAPGPQPTAMPAGRQDMGAAEAADTMTDETDARSEPEEAPALAKEAEEEMAIEATPPATMAAIPAEQPQDTDSNEEQADITRPTPATNPFTLTRNDHLSTFGLDVDTASYSSARNYITSGSLPPVADVRVEEFVNYFDYDYPQPEQATFGISIDAAPSPWGSGDPSGTQIVRVGIQGKTIDDSQRKDAMLTFVIDISGSMTDQNRLPMVKQALGLLVEQLRPTDQVAIVVYSDDTRIVLEHTSAQEHDRIMNAIESLQTEGSTNVEDGLRLGYQIAGQHFDTDAINRVILCSDGVANVGATGPDSIRAVIRDYQAQGIYLSTIGFGMGNYNDYLMEQLADDGNGNYAYVDTLDEANRVFVENLTGMLQVIARDAKVQVDFDPTTVHSYRLLGYENREVADEDFRDDEVDAGEIGAGHNVTALYEVVLTEQAERADGTDATALTVYMRYEDPDAGEVHEQHQSFGRSDFRPAFDDASPSFKLAVAVAGFAEQLRESGYVQDRSMEDVLRVAEQVAERAANDQDVQEFVELVRQASSL